MYEKLLVAVDHSKVTDRVLGAARDLAGLLLGSTAHKVIQLSDRPVLVVR
jgi:nucleotide-binding universal stress UspA family protein